MAIYRGDGGAGVANPTYETAVIADQTGNSGKYLTTDGSNTSWATISGTGTVTSASVVSANGFAGTVANATTTPAITLTTSITGILKGNGTAISAATSGTDYAPATSGTSILYGNGSGGFSNVTIGSGLTFSTGTLSASGGGNLDGLSDVVLTSPTTGQVLKYNGTNWINDTDSTGSGSFTYPGAGIAVSTGSAWGTSLTDNSSNWNTAYGWGNHASAGYLTSATAASTYQPLDADLTAIAGLTPTADNFIVGNGTAWILETPAQARTSLGLGTAATMTGPSGTIVGTTDTQTLSAKTLTSPIISSISNTGTLTLPTSTDTLVGRATTDTLTNKRITSRVGSTTSSATPTINTDNVDMYGLTAQAVDITSFTTNLTGTPTNGQKLWIYIVGTAARAITWGASFEASTVALPTTTVTTNRLDVGFVWNAVTSKWRCVAVA